MPVSAALANDMKIKIRPTEGARLEALKYPGGYVYVIAGNYGPDERVPPEAIVGAWRVDSRGRIRGPLVPNPNYRPRDACNQLKDGATQSPT